jgi:predicted transcriptional regulator
VTVKKREPILIHMEILASVFDSPKSITRLAQACNVNFGRIERFTEPLIEKGLLKVEAGEGGVKMYSITQEGYKVYQDWLEIWRRLPLE